jgi:hypothetical protein
MNQWKIAKIGEKPEPPASKEMQRSQQTKRPRPKGKTQGW